MQGYLFARPMENLKMATFVAEFDARSRPPALAAGDSH
jgi:EAL domain-containing protein (putative c-di-GMP-specific phosphodiesterase class I)